MTSKSSGPFADLMRTLSALNVDKYGAFKVINVSYKTVGTTGTAIHADILIPRILDQKAISNCPIIVRIHGGFLVTGSSLYSPWFSDWILEYAIQKEAIIISPNYRLLPEACGNDILQDMDDFWCWLQSGSLNQAIQNAGYHSIHAMIDRILLVGESAGGYLAMQLGLSYPSQIRAVIGAYPMLDLKSKFYMETYPKPIVGVPNVPNEVINNHLASVKSLHSPSIVTGADPPNRLKLAFSIFQNGRLFEFLGSDTENPNLFPIERVEHLASARRLELPPLFLFHGEQDSAVPVEGTRRFVSLLLRKGHTGNVRVHIQDGDHGFDYNATLETD